MTRARAGTGTLPEGSGRWAVVVGGLVAAGLLIASPGGVRLVAAIAALIFLGVFAVRSPRSLLAALVVWFVALGLLRRVVSGVSPKEAYGDPLLLVGAATWAVLAVIALRRGALQGSGSLTKAVVALAALLGASALNPLQGGLAVGLSGALLVVVPMAAFVVGRSLIDDGMLQRLLTLVGWLGLVVGAYGLYQTFVGFPPWDERWIDKEGYVALNVGGVIRAFASFSAASEYTSFLGMAMVVWVAKTRGLNRTSLGLLALALLGTALWFVSERRSIVLTVLAIGTVLTARAGFNLGRSLILGAAVLLALPLVIGRLAPAQFSGDAGGRLAKHQVEGLSDPFGEGSTLPLHIKTVAGGIRNAISDPLGVGVGAVTISGEKFEGTFKPTEADPGNAAVAAGFPGLLAYLAVVLLGLPRLYRRASRMRDTLSLSALGIVVVTSLQWLNGGHYAVAFWPWLILGWSDARQRKADGAIPDPSVRALDAGAENFGARAE